MTGSVSGDEELRVKLLEMKLEALVRSGGDTAADQALETFSQVIGDVKNIRKCGVLRIYVFWDTVLILKNIFFIWIDCM